MVASGSNKMSMAVIGADCPIDRTSLFVVASRLSRSLLASKGAVTVGKGMELHGADALGEQTAGVVILGYEVWGNAVGSGLISVVTMKDRVGMGDPAPVRAELDPHPRLRRYFPPTRGQENCSEVRLAERRGGAGAATIRRLLDCAVFDVIMSAARRLSELYHQLQTSNYVSL